VRRAPPRDALEHDFKAIATRASQSTHKFMRVSVDFSAPSLAVLEIARFLQELCKTDPVNYLEI
jgi:hypothetical protein